MKYWWPFAKRYKVKCPDGTVKTVYRNVEDAFPLYIKGWQAKIQANIDAIQNIPANLRAEYETKIHGLLYDLNDSNQSLMMAFRSVYVAYANDPCSKSDFFERQIVKLLADQHRLQALKIKIQGLISLAELQPNNSDEFIQAFKDLVHEIGGSSIIEAARLEIEESRTISENWVKGQDE